MKSTCTLLVTAAVSFYLATFATAFIPRSPVRCKISGRQHACNRFCGNGLASCAVRPSGRRHRAQARGVQGRGGLSMMFDNLAEALTSVTDLLKGQKTITESSVEGALKEVKRALIDADVNLKVTNKLVASVKEKAVGSKLVDGVTPQQQFIKVMNDELVEVMGAQQAPLARRDDGNPTVILMAGLQGTGKTTAAAKLAKFLKNEEEPKNVLLVAGDVYRPAAIDQLISLGKRIEVEVFTMGQDANPVDITKAGLEHAKEKGYDTVIVDTAGRQVVDDNLMAELKDMQVASKPDEVLLVVDAMTGQEAATLASVFNEKIGITGAILTKMDGDTRGGAALSVQGVSQKPIKFVGVGEKLDDLEPFYPDRMASRILGMGDVVSLVEKAQKEMSEEEAQKLAQKMIDSQFDFNDFLKQSRMMKSMGNIGNVAGMIPGMANKLTSKQINEVEGRVKNAEMLIAQMTPEERQNPELLLADPTSNERKRRIAKDAGVKMSQVGAFFKEFRQMQSYMASMGKQMGGMDPNATPSAETPFGRLGGLGGGGDAPPVNRQQRRKAKAGKAGGQAAAPSKGFG